MALPAVRLPVSLSKKEFPCTSMFVRADHEGVGISKVTDGTVAILQPVIELVAVRVFVTRLAGHGQGCELAHPRFFIRQMALGASHGQMPALQGIGFAVPCWPDVGRNEATAAVAVHASGIFFHKLPGMGIVMASPALIGLAHGIGKAFGIVELWRVASRAFKVGVGRLQCKAEGGMQRRIDSTLS